MNIFKLNGNLVDDNPSLTAPSMPTDYAKHAHARNSTSNAPKSGELDALGTNTEVGNSYTSETANEETVERPNIGTNNETSPNTSTGVHVHANARNSASNMSKVGALEVEVPKADVYDAATVSIKKEISAHDGPDDTISTNTNSKYNQSSEEGMTETPTNEIENTEWLELEETVQLLKERGILRAIRTVQRYCQIGKLTCVLTPTEKAARYIIAKNSIEDFIENHNQTMPSRGTPNFSRRDDTQLANDNNQSKSSAATELKKNDAISKDHFNHIIELKDQQIEILLSQANVSNKQLEMKDEQITSLLERDHETNVLLNNLQNQLALPTNHETKHNYHNQAYDIHPNQSSLDG